MSVVNEGVLERLRKLVEGLELRDDQVLTDIIVVAKSVALDDNRVGVCYNFDSNDWLVRRGLLDAAIDIETEHPPRQDEDEE